MIRPIKISDQFRNIVQLGAKLAPEVDADALMIMLDGPTDWLQLKQLAGEVPLFLAADDKEALDGADAEGLKGVVINVPDGPIYEKLTQALVESVAEEVLAPGSRVVAIYSGFEVGIIDSMSVINLSEHLERLTSRDLRSIETNVPLETLKCVVDLALDIGREGREGKPVGTLFVVGDTRRVLASSHPTGFDPVRGYSRKERVLTDARVREGIKEIAQMDGAFIISPTVWSKRAARYIDAPAKDIT